MSTLLLWMSVALAESAGTLPGGSHVVYAGAGVNTFSQIRPADGEPVTRDRLVRSRLDLYYAAGLGKRSQVAVSLPIIRSAVSDDPALWPCPDDVSYEGYCDPVLSAGKASVEGRIRWLDKGLTSSVGLGLLADPWNAGTRGRYTSVGEGTVDLQPVLLAGRDFKAGDWGIGLLGRGAYAWRFSRMVEADPQVRAPADHFSAGGEVTVNPPGLLSFDVGADHTRRLWGVDWDDAWVSTYFPLEDRWAVLWYRHTFVYGKVSVTLPKNMGLHVGVGKVVHVRNGPPDSWDFTLGVHRYFAPKG